MHSSTVLIIDDEPIGRESLEALLTADGYHVIGAGSGPEALARAATLVPDVIVLDVMMPGMDGYTVCRYLRADPLLADVPIIMLTALDDRRSRIQGIEAGADDFVSKPFDRVELQVRIRTITRLDRYRRLLVERAKFEWIVEQADDGYLLVNNNDSIHYANPRARRYLSLPLDTSLPISDSFRALAARQFTCEPQRAWADWPPRQAQRAPSPLYLVRPETPALNAFWLQVDALALPSNAGVGWLVALRDVTTQMAVQRDIWKFHATVNHKLRTPLVGMVNGMQLLAQRAPELSGEEIARYAQSALKSSLRLQTSVNDIMQFIAAPTLARPVEGVRLSALQALVRDVATTAGIEQIAIVCQESGPLATLALSQQALAAVLQEVLENARKFHPTHEPRIDVRVTSARPGKITIAVRDNGLTLSPEQIAHACVPYHQGEKVFTGEIEGMGLGLAMVAALLWSIGGTCVLANRDDGPGIIVELVIPLAKYQTAPLVAR